jgi:hypothetical protein
MKSVTVNIIWDILHSRGRFKCSLNNDLYSEHYLDDTSQQVGTGIAA